MLFRTSNDEKLSIFYPAHVTLDPRPCDGFCVTEEVAGLGTRVASPPVFVATGAWKKHCPHFADHCVYRIDCVFSLSLCVQLTQNGDARTQYSIEVREDGFSAPNTANRLFYPLQAGTTYGVEVSCCQDSEIRTQ